MSSVLSVAFYFLVPTEGRAVCSVADLFFYLTAPFRGLPHTPGYAGGLDLFLRDR